MLTTYIAAANNTTGGVAIGNVGQNVEITGIVIGNPVSSANIWIYDETNVGNTSNTSGLKSKITLPGSLATGQLPFVLDLTDRAGHGIVCASGGSVAIDQSLQATVIWGPAQMESNTI